MAETRVIRTPSLRTPPVVFFAAFVSSAAVPGAFGHRATSELNFVSKSAAATPILELEGMREGEREERAWQAFLDAELEKDGAFSHKSVRAARRIWRDLTKRIAEVPLPSTSESVDGTLLLSWSNTKALVEVEIFGDGTLEWFCRWRATGRFDGSNDERLAAVPVKLIDVVEAAIA